MRPVIALLLYILFVFAGGAFLSPWLYFALQKLAEFYHQLAGLAASPFHRYVNRCLLVLALAGLYPLIRALGLKWADLGLNSSGSKSRPFISGFAFGLFSLALLVLLTICLGLRKINVHPGAHEWARHIPKTILVAMVVATLEEVLFRGAIFSALRKTTSTALALIFSSGIYAIVHFFSRPESPTNIEWYSGFTILGRMFQGFIDPAKVFPGFLNLTLAGLILALLFHRSANLWWCIGLHAGWIFWLKTYNFSTIQVVEQSQLWGTSKLIDGWMAFPILLATGWLVLRQARRNSKDVL